MAIQTKKVSGRREVHYQSVSELLADAERLAQGPVQSLGNWTPAQVFQHLAVSLNGSIDGMSFKLPAPARWVMSLLMKRKFLTVAVPAGFRTPDEYVASADTPLDDALASLRNAIQRQQTEPKRALHPGFGNLSREEWEQFHLRHAELHMSFLQPAG
jgi:hypothetical protein